MGTTESNAYKLTFIFGTQKVATSRIIAQFVVAHYLHLLPPQNHFIRFSGRGRYKPSSKYGPKTVFVVPVITNPALTNLATYSSQYSPCVCWSSAPVIPSMFRISSFIISPFHLSTNRDLRCGLSASSPTSTTAPAGATKLSTYITPYRIQSTPWSFTLAGASFVPLFAHT